MPDGWQSLVSDLLVPPTELSFWDDTTTLEDREVAQRQACKILGEYQSDECACIGNNGASTYTEAVWDFADQDHDFVVTPGYHGVYQYGHWESEKYQGEDDYWYSELGIERLLPEAWPYSVKAYCDLNCFSGPMLTFPKFSFGLYGTEASPVAYSLQEFNAGYWSSPTYRPLLQVQSYRSVKADVLTFYWQAVATSEAIIDLAYCVLKKVEYNYELPG